jgi:thioesterase domain-containing protein
MGGMIAIEVASQLVTNGDVVGHVFMFDTFGPELKLDRDEFRFENVPQKVVNKLKTKWKHLLFLSRAYAYQLKGKTIPHPIRYQFISNKNLKAMQTFNPGRSDFPLTLIRALQELKGVYLDPYLGWKSILKGKLKIIEIAGDHSSFIETQDFLETLKMSVSTYKDK